MGEIVSVFFDATPGLYFDKELKNNYIELDYIFLEDVDLPDHIIKLIKDKDPVLDTLIPAPIFVPHIRKEKVVKEKPGFLKDPV